MSKPACSAPTTVAGPYPAEAESARTPAHQGCRANGSARRRRPASTPPAGQIPGLLLLPPPRRVRAPPFPRPSLPCPRARDNIFPAAASVGTQLHLTSQPPAWLTLTASPSSGSSNPAPPEKATALASPPLPSPLPALQRATYPLAQIAAAAGARSIDEGALLRVRGGRGARALLRRRGRPLRALRPRRARRQPPRRQAPPPAAPAARRRLRARLRHMPGVPCLLLLRRGPRAALPELRRRRAHGQRLRLRPPKVPPHRRPGRPAARRPGTRARSPERRRRRRSSTTSPANTAARQEGAQQPGAALQRRRHRLGGRRPGRRRRQEPARLVARRRAVRRSGADTGGADGEQNPVEAEPPADTHCRVHHPGRLCRGHAGLAAGRVLRLLGVQRRPRLHREWHVQG